MQDEEQPPDVYDPDALRDPEVGFDLIGYLQDHPIAIAIVVVAVVIFFFWLMRRRTGD